MVLPRFMHDIGIQVKKFISHRECEHHPISIHSPVGSDVRVGADPICQRRRVRWAPMECAQQPPPPHTHTPTHPPKGLKVKEGKNIFRGLKIECH
jgi:hypothetical protein